MNKEYILDFLKTHKQELHTRFGVASIGLFGSYAKNLQTEQSDIDLAVEIQSENSFRSFFGLKSYLEAQFGKTIDLGIEHDLKPIVREYVKKEIIYV
ncbi:MAG: nucleotidyltransferase family protein [Sulfuricurvum sp.]